MTSATTRVLLADDHRMIRDGFRLILDAQPDIQVIGEAADGSRALELTALLHPDIVLADIRMPGIDGLELTRRLAGPGVDDPTRVIVVTTYDLDEYVTEALRSGACGFLLKRSGPTLLVEAIRAAMAGDTLLSPQVTVRLLRRLTPSEPAHPATPPLTDRERDIVSLVAQGKTNDEIAAHLFISIATVKPTSPTSAEKSTPATASASLPGPGNQATALARADLRGSGGRSGRVIHLAHT